MFRVGGRLGRSGLRGSRRSRLAVEGEELRLVALDGAEERVVVGRAFGGDLAQEEMDGEGSGDGQSFGRVLGGEGGVVAGHRRAGGGSWDVGGREREGHVVLALQRRGGI